MGKGAPNRRWTIASYDHRGMHWNTSDGWVPYAQATLFTDEERRTEDQATKSNLPMCEGHWRVWRAPKPAKPGPLKSGDTLWVMSYNTHNALGSISHVSNGDKLYPTQEACQHEIDTMEGWIGMGDRSRYRPMPLTLA